MSAEISTAEKTELWWIPDPIDVWTLATQNSPPMPNGLVNFLIQRDGKIAAHPFDKCLPALSHLNYPEDLVYLHDVNQATILACIRQRFKQQKIYTSIGLVLLSVNPFRMIPGLYGDDMMKKYLDPYQKNLSAHVYLVPSRAYQTMCRTGGSQSILISGESGAGKTEATKQCLSFLTYVANQNIEGTNNNEVIEIDQITSSPTPTTTSSTAAATTTKISEIAARVIAASPILEAFGNAMTLRNPNSSRFGKWMVLNFTPSNIISSSNIISYLLEKSRVTNRDARERNYHIFYQIILGCSLQQLEEWKLTNDIDSYQYLIIRSEDSQSKQLHQSIHDVQSYQLTMKAFLNMGFTEDEIINIYRLIAGLLHLGNITFHSILDDEASEISNSYVLDNVAKCFHIESKLLSFSLCHRTIESGKTGRGVASGGQSGSGNVINIQLNKQKAIETRDSLARNIYDKIFQMIILKLNLKSSKDIDDHETTSAETSASSAVTSASDRCIGLLDIFGFEIFDENSFEQLCINYCNEMLQHHFNYVIFTTEKTLYAMEGITCDTIDFRDNTKVMKEIEMMFKSLDEEGRIPKGSSKTWYEKMKREHGKLTKITFPNRRKSVIFQVKHYAGDVDYSPKGLMEKNIETINNDLVNAMLSSKDLFLYQAFSMNILMNHHTNKNGNNHHHNSVVDITTPSPRNSFRSVAGQNNRLSGAANSLNAALSAAAGAAPPIPPPPPPPPLSTSTPSSSKTTTSGGRKGALVNKSISWKFTHQLNDLITMLNKTESHFIRCIKSNEGCFPIEFESPLIHRQLLYSGVFEVVKIQQSGLPCRLLHSEFINSYKCLASSKIRYSINSSSELIKHLNQKQKLNLQYFQYGRTMIFFKTSEQRILENTKDFLIFSSIIKIQKKFRRNLFFLLFQKLIKFYHEFNYYDEQLLYSPTEEAFFNLEQIIQKYTFYKKYKILNHLLIKTKKKLQTLLSRVDLIKKAKDKIINRSKENIESLDEIILSSIELEMTEHPIILDCKQTLQQYQKAVNIIEIMNGSNDIITMSSTQINDGMEALENFEDILMDGKIVLESIKKHKKAMDEEIKVIKEPLQNLFLQSRIKFDNISGQLISIDKENGKNSLQKLRELLYQYEEKEFLCLDTKEIFHSCQSFLYILDDFIHSCDTKSLIEFLQSKKILEFSEKNSDFFEQMEEFQKWADIQLSSERLKELFSQDNVSATAIGNEKTVEINEMESILLQLSKLTEPSFLIKSTVKAGTWILKLRKAYLLEKWEELEELVFEADRDGVENYVFDGFVDCIEELNSCQWQVIYHGLINDILFVLGEPIFSSISLQNEQWNELIKDLPENMTLIETCKSFSLENESPSLFYLIPVLESMLQLRSLMFQHEIELSKNIHKNFVNKFLNIFEIFPEIKKPIENELKACFNLIRKIELEDELNIAIKNEPALVYVYEGINDLPCYTGLCDLTHSVEDLNEVLGDIDELLSCNNNDDGRFHDSLQEKVDLTRVLKVARTNLSLAEDADASLAVHASKVITLKTKSASNDSSPVITKNKSIASGAEEEDEMSLALGPLAGNPQLGHWIDWEAILADFEEAIEDSLIVSTTLPSYFEEEYRIITGEFIRRSLVQGFRSILGTSCVKGEVDINIHVVEDELNDQFHKYNILAQIMGPHFEEFPINLRNLSLFTTAILRLRKNVLENKWDRSIHTLLDKIKTMDHGGGRPNNYDTTLTKNRTSSAEFLSIASSASATSSNTSSVKALLPPTPKLKPTAMLVAIRSNSTPPTKVLHLPDMNDLADELLKVEQELVARESLLTLKKALENVRIRVPDAAADSMADMVDLEPLKSACEGVKNHKGKHSMQLLSLAKSLMNVLETLLAGDLGKIDQKQVDDCAIHYLTYNLNSTSVEAVFKYIRVHTFLKNLCSAMEHDTAEQIMRELNEVRDSLDPIPKRFIPWLKASYIYCELVQAFATEDWIQIVESTRKVEECINVLSSVQITTEGEGFNEGQFLDLLRAKAIYGYSTALRIREEEENEHTLTVYQNMTADQVTKEKLCKEDALNPYGIKQLRKAGYDDDSILNVKFPVKFLWALDFDPALLRRKGFKAKKLLEAGYSVQSLYYAGYSVEKLKAADVSISVLRETGVSVDRLKLAGFEDEEILKHGGNLPKDFLESFGASKLVRMGMAVSDLIKAGFSPLELRAAGFTALELKSAGLSDAAILRDAGYGLESLKSAFDIAALKDCGFSFDELQESGVTDKSLFDAGFHIELEYQALMDLFHVTNGPLWKFRMNWGSSAQPISKWYGITVEIDEDGNERVKGLDLTDNHLTGTIPPRLALLTRMISLKLGMNFIKGPVPAQLAALLRKNQASTDLNIGVDNVKHGMPTPFLLNSTQSPTRSGVENNSILTPNKIDHGGVQLFSPSTGGTALASNVSSIEHQKFNNYYDNFLSPEKNAEDDDSMDVDLERLALMELYDSTNGSRWRSRTNWGSQQHVGTWKGITVNRAGKVVKLDLASNNLNGPIPKSIYYLDHLKEINLRLNQLSGPLPETLGHIQPLTHCYLHSNKLAGNLPESLATLSSLQVLDLRSNQFSGRIPRSFAHLQKLKYFGLKSNKFTTGTDEEMRRILPYCKIVF